MFQCQTNLNTSVVWFRTKVIQQPSWSILNYASDAENKGLSVLGVFNDQAPKWLTSHLLMAHH